MACPNQYPVVHYIVQMSAYAKCQSSALVCLAFTMEVLVCPTVFRDWPCLSCLPDCISRPSALACSNFSRGCLLTGCHVFSGLVWVYECGIFFIVGFCGGQIYKQSFVDRCPCLSVKRLWKPRTVPLVCFVFFKPTSFVNFFCDRGFDSAYS